MLAFVFQNAGNDFDSVIQRTVVANPKMCANRTKAFVRRSVNKSFDARLNESAGAHRARLNRRKQSCADQTIISNRPCSIAKSNNFGVSRGIAKRSSAITGCRQKLAFARNHNCANWDFIQLCDGKSRGVYRFTHPIRIIKVFVKIAVHNRKTRAPKSANCKYRFRRKQCQASVFCRKALFVCFLRV